MDFFLPEDHLTRSLPEHTRITELSVESYADGRRLRIYLEVTPFQKRPHIEVTLVNSLDEEIASTSIVEPLSWKLEFTMHLRGEIQNPYTLKARLYYPEGPSQEPQSHIFDVIPSSAAPN